MEVFAYVRGVDVPERGQPLTYDLPYFRMPSGHSVAQMIRRTKVHLVEALKVLRHEKS